MKKVSIKYQIFLSMTSLIGILFLVIYIGMNELVPRLYETQIQNEMQQEIDALEDNVLSTVSALTLNLASFIEASSYRIDMYSLEGEGVYHSSDKDLRTQTLILLQNGIIESRYFDGSRLFFTRIVTLDRYIIQISADVASFYTMLTVINRLTLIVGMSTFIVGIIISFILSQRMSQPIKLLSNQIRLNQPFTALNRGDEIGLLSQTLFQYQTKLENVIEELKRELQREKQQDHLMKTFIANVSHELQTPLSIMLIAIETLEDKIIDKDVKQSYTQMIRSEIFHLKHITQDLIIISSNHSRRLELYKTKQDVLVLCNDVMDEMKLIYPNANIRFHSNKKTWIHAFDAVKMKQVLYNIIRNGLVHQSKTQDIHINLTWIQEELHLSICNPNSHISDDDLPHIFDAFYKKESKGSGLGLSIVKTILEAHQFDFHIKNKDDGVCFYIIWR